MSNLLVFCADTLLAESRDEWQQPDRVVADLGLKPGDVVADVGCGSGYFTFRLALAVGAKGKVLAVDTDGDALKAIRQRVDRERVANIETVQSEPTDANLKGESVDAVLLCDVIHEVPEKQRADLVRSIVTGLKPGGFLFLIDYRKSRDVKFDPYERLIPRDDLVKLLTDAGLVLDAEFHYLKYQIFVRFRKPTGQPASHPAAQPASRPASQPTAATYRAVCDELLMVFYAGVGHTTGTGNPKFPKAGQVQWMKSSDGGRTWTVPSVLADTEDDDRDPSVKMLSDGTLLCNFFKSRYGRIRVAICTSADRGKTWSEPNEVPTPFDWVSACSAPVCELRDGTLVLPLYGCRLSDRGEPKEHYVGHLKAATLRSKDRGRTWGDFRVLTPDANEERSEPAVIELPDGGLWCVIRRNAFVTTSPDHGLSWTPPQKEPKFGGYCYAPDLLLTSRGSLVCAHNGVNVNVSIDQGRTWRDRRLVAKGYGYPSLAELEDGQIFLTYYDDTAAHLKKNEKAEIRGAYFRVDEKGDVVDVSDSWVILGSDPNAPWGSHPGFPSVTRLSLAVKGKPTIGSGSPPTR